MKATRIFQIGLVAAVIALASTSCSQNISGIYTAKGRTAGVTLYLVQSEDGKITGTLNMLLCDPPSSPSWRPCRTDSIPITTGAINGKQLILTINRGSLFGSSLNENVAGTIDGDIIQFPSVLKVDDIAITSVRRSTEPIEMLGPRGPSGP